MQSTTNNQTNFEHQKRNTRVTTSGSDVSVTRNENTLSGLHRNSSSGWVDSFLLILWYYFIFFFEVCKNEKNIIEASLRVLGVVFR